MATSHEATTGHGVRKAGVEDEGLNGDPMKEHRQYRYDQAAPTRSA